uniref:Serine/threonine protein kinase n=1 Tax=uncultured bacterium F42-01 TaxID=1191438 RepID=I3VIK0_9BACT|nr:serine/threonine protein kinase [uncultured bacterium F42-01]
MGEVYRARDPKLGRDVAIKILRGDSASEPGARARFEREARTVAALNHPQIVTIHEIAQVDGRDFIVMELVPGESLDRLIPKRGLTVEQATDYAAQIAAALETAHCAGVVHRDIKPANVMVSNEGQVKVLDFGLAKLLDRVDPSATIATAPLVTEAGAVIGTVAYMSPEQARGKSVDKRSDIWAFGCVLYEMLTGRRAFPGETLSDTIVSILERSPEWAALPSGTPAIVAKLLRRCLEKDPHKRLRDIGDARLDLEDSETGGRESIVIDARTPIRDVEFQRLTDVEGLKETPAISPDGRMVAFVAMVAGKRHIWIRLLAGGSTLQLTRDDVEHMHPRWAPDSSTLIYYTPPPTQSDDGTIWEIGALGGWPRRIINASGAGDISHDGQRIAFLQAAVDQVALVVCARDGSQPARVALLPGASYTFPRWAPDDRSVAIQHLGNASFDGHIDVVNLATGARHEVVKGTWLRGFAWLPDGSGLVYSSSRGSTLLYPPVFNLRVVQNDGSGDRQLTFGDLSYGQPDVHRSGKLVACRTVSHSDIWKFPVDGTPAENTARAVRVTKQTGQVQVPSVSPDEREIVFVSDTGGHSNLWVVRTDGTAMRPLTFEVDPAIAIGLPVWSPRGDWIAFVRSDHGQAATWGIRPDGSGLRQLAHGWGPCWSADGRWLYYWRLTGDARGIDRIPTDGGPAEFFVRTGEEICLPAISPDGATIFLAQGTGAGFRGWWGTDFLEFVRAHPPDSDVERLARAAGERLPARYPCIVISRDGRYLATSLVDGATTNIWVLPTAGGPMTPVTDFGDRSVLIVRSMSWSADSQHLYAAVAEIRTDIVLLDGLIGPLAGSATA